MTADREIEKALSHSVVVVTKKRFLPSSGRPLSLCVEYPDYGAGILWAIGGRKVTAFAEARLYTLVFWLWRCNDT